MYLQDFTHMFNQFIHGKIRLIHIIVNVITGCLFRNQEFKKRYNVTDISHRLLIIAIPHHQEFATRYLPEQIINIPPVVFTEYDRRTDYVYIPVRMSLIPFLQHLLRFPFTFPVMIKRICRMIFIRTFLIQSINGNRAGKDNPLDSICFHCFQRITHTSHIHVIIKGYRRHIIPMFCSQQNNDIRSRQRRNQFLLVQYIGNRSDFRIR